MEEQKKKMPEGMLDQLPPRMAFWSGVVVSGGVLFAAAFIVLVVMMFKGIEIVVPGADGTTTKTTTTTNTNKANTNAAADVKAVAQPTVAGTVAMDGLTNVRGSGDLTIVEFSDPECPFCKRFHDTMKEIVSDYDGKVRWAYKHLPLTSLHQKAEREALATECAAEQSKFWEYIDLLYETTTSNDGLADEELFNMADTVGLNSAQFSDCLESEKYLDKVRAEAAEAQKLGGTGTPFSVLVDSEGNILESFPGALPTATMSQTIDGFLQ